MVINLSEKFRKLYIVVGIVSASSCMSARDGDALQQDLLDTKTKLLDLQAKIDQTAEKTETSGKTSNLRLANSTTKIDQFEREIQTLRGEIDTLRVRVETGRVPGVENGEEELDAPLSLESLTERVRKLEEAQIEMLEALEKGGKLSPKEKKQANKGANKGSGVLANLDDFQSAFQAKEFTAITKQAADAMKKLKGEEKKEVAFLEAESLYRLEKLKDAALKFNQFIEAYKNGSRAEEAQMRMGDCFRRLGDQDTALIYYKELIDKHPKSAHADKAKERIQQLEGKKSA